MAGTTYCGDFSLITYCDFCIYLPSKSKFLSVIARRVNGRYPGLSRRLGEALTDPRLQASAGCSVGGTLLPLYHRLVCGAECGCEPELDKKAGLMPSDRLFIKRMKRIRDVATLLLVDLSRSTANAVDGHGTRVLDVEKQAIVLLCEALQVVGDRFAIAGFSGTGPLGVDYYRIKDLDAPFDDAVRGRIGAMAPQRSTRMGAAIRHATALLARQQARIRLILILGDGFPNDLEYKGAYAVEDTRRAVMEARTARIQVREPMASTPKKSFRKDSTWWT
jgi:hypothetical protein